MAHPYASDLDDVDVGLRDVAGSAVTPDAHDSHDESEAREAGGDDLPLEEALNLAADLLAVDVIGGGRRGAVVLDAPVAGRVGDALADDVVAHLHAAGGRGPVPAGLSRGRRAVGCVLLPRGQGHEVGRNGVGDGEPGGQDEDRGV